MNVPPLVNDPDATSRFARSLWGLAVAGATSFLAGVNSVTITMWKAGTQVESPMSPPLMGHATHLPAPRVDTPAVMLDSGHVDALSLRRFPIIGAPNAWVSDRLVTPDGRRAIEQMGQRIMIASNSTPYDLYFGLYLAYDAAELAELEVAASCAFREVRYWRVLHHTLRAPDPSLGP